MKCLYNISFALVLILFAASESVATIPHPVSHTDAWVKVSKHVDVRLNVFLDDVLRHEGCLPGPDSEQLVTKLTVQKAIAAHGQKLQQQLRIFQDQGEPLVGIVVSEPKWKPNAAMIDLSVDSSLKLTWKLRYEFVEGRPSRQLLFLHDFTHPSLEQTGELRLHLQDSGTGRRIDAVIPARQPHTIILPEAGGGLMGSDQSANLLVFRIVVGPTHVVVEVSAPVLLMNAAYPGVEQLKDHLAFETGNFSGPIWESSDQADAKLILQTWATKNLQVQINGSSANSVSEVVEFFPITPSAERDSEAPAVRIPSALPLIGTAAGIRFVYVRPRSVARVAIHLKQSPGDFDEANISVSGPHERFSILQSLNDGAATADQLEFEWDLEDRKANSEVATDDLAGQATESPSAIQVTGKRSNSSIVIAAAVFLGGLACFGFGMFTAVKRPKMALLVLLASILIAAMQLSGRSYTVDAAEVSELVQSHLSNVYLALQQTDEQASIELLSDVLDDNMLEQIYIEALKSLDSEEETPLAIIRQIDVRKCEMSQIQSNLEMVADCHWQVDAAVEHWGHSHDRSLQFKGRFGLVVDEGRWKIRTFQATSVSQPSS